MVFVSMLEYYQTSKILSSKFARRAGRGDVNVCQIADRQMLGAHWGIRGEAGEIWSTHEKELAAGLKS